ncbi:hypothetical protein CIW83_18250 [Tissierella sp. P1]|uniref:hypothetical protein n=1 Tax=Tissierella sp. P1 TaxID=1280483 RepID=UPI000BA11859|nr:hypothetical protein [Tissierella sp. P1]OZV10763.1 hypothetical protein CIW83_18250 [Tissierella sp. P1]
MKVKTCTKCGEEYPATTMYFHKAKTCKDGLNSKCKYCINENYKKKYKTGKYKSNKNYKSKMEEKMKREQEAFERVMNEKVEGLDISKVKLVKDKQYKIYLRRNYKKVYDLCFEGTMIRDYKTHILFKHKLGYSESFLKADFLTGEYKVKEI